MTVSAMSPWRMAFRSVVAFSSFGLWPGTFLGVLPVSGDLLFGGH